MSNIDIKCILVIYHQHLILELEQGRSSGSTIMEPNKYYVSFINIHVKRKRRM